MIECPRCGERPVDVETIKAERMPDREGTRRFEPVGTVYYHSNGLHCGIPRVGEAYPIVPGAGKRLKHQTTGGEPCRSQS